MEHKENPLRQTLKSRLVDYIKAANIPYYPPEIFDCPVCGFTASILNDRRWSCKCGKHGDVVDLAILAQGYSNDEDAIKGICRLLHIKITQLSLIAANDLMEMELPDSRFLIEKLMGKGLYILAGAPKVGKSWMVMLIAHCVSKGIPLWGLPTAQHDVLYMSLEDTLPRIQNRLDLVTGGETGNIWIATEAELVGNGLEEQLTNQLTANPSIGLVILDTLQRVRPGRNEQYSYSADYEDMGVLKRLADQFGITILLVHHTRKQGASDAFDRISGTTGILGCADGAMVFQKDTRMENQGVLDVTGRDVADLRIRLSQNRENGVWEFLSIEGQEPEQKADPLLEAVAAFVTRQGAWQGTATELLNLLCQQRQWDIRPNVLTRRLKKNTDILEKVYGIRYSGCNTDLARTASARKISLSVAAASDDDDGNDDKINSPSRA